VTNVTFSFETSPNKTLKEKCGGTRHIMFPQSEKLGRHVPRVPHQIAPMVILIPQYRAGVRW